MELTIRKVLTNAQAAQHCVWLNPIHTTVENVTIGNVVFPVAYDPKIAVNKIGISRPTRSQNGMNVGDTITVQA